MANANMRDVAERAGVSVATVSHVINNTRFVTEETRQRVLDSIQALHYSPDAMARIFKTGHKNLIGFIVPNINDQFCSTLIEEVENGIGRENYKLIVANTHETAQREIENIRLLANGIVDGLMIASTLRNYEDVRRLVPEGFPIVLIDRTLPFCPWDTVRVNAYDAVAAATEDLIRDGHTKIVCFRNHPYLSTCVERLDAYEETMRKFGLEPNVIPLTNPTSTQLLPFMDRVMESGATALVAPNNTTTIASVNYFAEHHVVIGSDMALVAFQDVEEPNILLRHAAIVRQPVVDLGRAAAQQILARLAKPDLPAREIVLQATYLPKR